MYSPTAAQICRVTWEHTPLSSRAAGSQPPSLLQTCLQTVAVTSWASGCRAVQDSWKLHNLPAHTSCPWRDLKLSSLNRQTQKQSSHVKLCSYIIPHHEAQTSNWRNNNNRIFEWRDVLNIIVKSESFSHLYWFLMQLCVYVWFLQDPYAEH